MPLHNAVQEGYLGVVQLLVEAKAPLDAEGLNGRGPQMRGVEL